MAREARGSQATKGMKKAGKGAGDVAEGGWGAAPRLNPYVKFMRGQAASTEIAASSREKRVDARHWRRVKLV